MTPEQKIKRRRAALRRMAELDYIIEGGDDWTSLTPVVATGRTRLSRMAKVLRDLCADERSMPDTIRLPEYKCEWIEHAAEMLEAIAAGTQRAETGETPAPSEGCQSGGVAASPSPSHRSTGE